MKETNKQDKSRGCLVDSSIVDAFCYAVEFN